jgi:hypothetical protein
VTERRERVIFWSLAAFFAAATAVAYLVVVGPEPGSGVQATTPVVRPPEADATPVRLAVRTISGAVSVLRRGAPTAARAGDPVQRGDTLEVGLGARAELGDGELAIALGEGTRVALREAGPGRLRLRLEAGLVETKARGTVRVEIEAGPGAVARAVGATLWVSRAEGVTGAAVRGGAGELRSEGVVVSLRDGERAAAVDGASPSGASPVPSALPLDVRWPPARTRLPRVTVTGSTAPGALVVVCGARVEVRPDGTFAREVELHQGPQRLEVRAESAGGLRAAREGTVTLDARAPAPRFDTSHLWRRR